jgi:uncharacterized phage protein (TIGR01671 family)
MRGIKFRVYKKPIEYMLYGVESDTMFYYYLQDSKVVVMQYTGIKDINNKEIYEGDLVMVEDYPKWEGSFKVVWDDKQSMYALEDYYGDKEALHEFEKYRIIGNIYENKNLLEEDL